MERVRREPRITKRASTASRPVGYGNPPHHTRFLKGQSGNPAGRRAGSNNLKTVVLNSAQELVTVNDCGRPRTMSKLEAMANALSGKAAAGDPRATQLYAQMLQMFEGRPEQSAAATVLEHADELVVKQLYVRIAELMKGITNETPDPS